MKLTKYKLTPLAMILVFAAFAVPVFLGIWFFGFANKPSSSNNEVVQSNTSNPTTTQNATKSNESTAINLSISEKVSWKPILDANGGLTTQPGSIYDKLGIKVNIKLDNNNDSGINDLTSGKVNAFGNTVNAYSAMYKKFADKGVETVVPYIVDSSAGADGVVVKGNINSAADFVGKKIGVPNLSSDQAMVIWLMLKSDLTQDQLNQIKSKIVVYDSVGKAADGFANDEVDVVGVRQQYLVKAKGVNGAKVLFTTKTATNLISNGIIFRKDFADKNADTITKFIDGALEATQTVKSLDNIKLQPSFKNLSDAEINQMLTETKFNNYTDNNNLLGGMVQQLFEDMNKVWEVAGQGVVNGSGTKAFTKTYIDKLNGKYKVEVANTTKINEAQKQKAQAQSSDQALLKKSTSISFQPNSANFLNADESAKSLEEFVNIAKIMDGAVIEIEGNVAKVGTDDEQAATLLSKARANTVAKYLQGNGVDASRFIIKGNGTSKQIGDNSTQEGQVTNRRTDIFFKVIE